MKKEWVILILVIIIAIFFSIAPLFVPRFSPFYVREEVTNIEALPEDSETTEGAKAIATQDCASLSPPSECQWCCLEHHSANLRDCDRNHVGDHNNCELAYGECRLGCLIPYVSLVCEWQCASYRYYCTLQIDANYKACKDGANADAKRCYAGCLSTITLPPTTAPNSQTPGAANPDSSDASY
jgi:hypothetical protein